MGRQWQPSEYEGDYVLPPEGTAAAVLTVLAYLGRHESSWQGQQRIRELIGLQWELDGTAEDGRTLAVNEVMTASTNERAKLYGRVLAITGGREPAPGFDLERLLGHGAIVTVAHTTKPDGRTYADVANAGPLPRGMAAPTPSVQLTYYDVEQHDAAAYERLPARFKKLVETALGAAGPAPRPSPRPAQPQPGAPTPQQPPTAPPSGYGPPPQPEAGSPIDDDIPF